MRDGNGPGRRSVGLEPARSEPTYEGWKLLAELHERQRRGGSEPTYEGWKREANGGGVCKHALVPSLPMRDGNHK